MRPINRRRNAAMLGLGFDADDGHTRITKGDNFLLWGGSHDTHSIMQETVIKINEGLDKHGLRLEDATPKELRRILREVWRQIAEDRS